MGRTLRPNLPGVPFHLTARVQGKAPLLRGIEPTVARLLAEQVDRSGGELLAFAVMPNHLHLIYVQGDRGLAAYMQPLLRRLALRIHARYGTEGHVFERRFRAHACKDPDYLRNAILYVHLNPVRAQLCDGPGKYAWTTHDAYCQARPGHLDWRGKIGSCVRLFAPTEYSAPAAIRANYTAFLEWRLKADAAQAATSAGRLVAFPTPPRYAGGDAYWIERFGAACTRRVAGAPVRIPTVDLRDLALRTLLDTEPDMPLDLLRSGRRLRAVVAVRRQFILRARENGYRSCSIARFLRVDDATVCRTR